MTAKQKIFWLRLVTLIGLCLPALELAWRWYNGDLEPRPVTVATHATGDWAVIFLMLSLAMTPARALFDWMPLVQIRRRIGVAAALYAGAHFLIYVLDQKWNLVVVATEIIKRFYLTIGFVALLALVVARHHLDRRLAEAAQAQLEAPALADLSRGLHRHRPLLHPVEGQDRRARLHRRPVRLADAVARPAGEAAAQLPGTRRSWPLPATFATVVFEAAWYWLVNGRDPIVALLANLDPELAFRPAQKVLIASLLVIAAVALRRLTLAANKLWTKRYIQSTIPAP